MPTSPEESLQILKRVAATRRQLDELERQAVEQARSSGATWQQVANALGISRQAAHEKHASRPAGSKGKKT